VILIQPLTLYEIFSLANYAIVLIALIISLYLVRLQAREMASQTKSLVASLESNTYQNIPAQMFTLDEIFINHPELRPYFYSGKEIGEDDSNYQRVLATAEFVLDLFGTSFDLMPRYPQNWPRSAWEEYVKDFFANSPILCKFLSSNSAWYPKELLTLMNAAEIRGYQQNDTKSHKVELH
jgi:hypothetical protein